jgi:membrane-associated phospholipid phosphatase
VQQRPENQYQTLRSVDPGTAVERLPVPPAARDFGVPPLIGRQWRAPERSAEGDRERSRAPRSERWGPPQAELDRRTAVLALTALTGALALTIYIWGLSLTPDRMLLVLLAPALVLRRVRVYLMDFVPFAALIILYAELRGLAHVAQPSPYYAPQLHAERWLFGGDVPSAYLQHHVWQGGHVWYDTVLFDITRVHSIVPPALAFLLWMRRRALFYRFAATILALSYAAVIVFVLFPSAPPWAASIGVTRLGASASSLPYLAPVSLSHVIDSNPYAAIPSLHAGYSFLVFLFISTLFWKSRWRWRVVAVTALYPLAQSFAAVYTGNHYVVDLVIGYAFAAAAMFGVRAVWRWRRLPE